MLSDFEQKIYNEYLKTSRQAKNQPYRLRKNFDDIPSDVLVYLKRISNILRKFPSIHVNDYFKAPYSIYGVEEYFDLKYFTSQKAIRAYTLYVQKEPDFDPDSEDMLLKVLDSLKFLKEFLFANNISLQQYPSHMTNEMKSFILHWKERKIHPYVLIELPNALYYIRHEDQELLKFMFGENVYENIQLYTNRYFSSKKLKVLIKQGLKKL
jgi:hypothetical protein